jgi:hypothetical protein
MTHQHTSHRRVLHLRDSRFSRRWIIFAERASRATPTPVQQRRTFGVSGAAKPHGRVGWFRCHFSAGFHANVPLRHLLKCSATQIPFQCRFRRHAVRLDAVKGQAAGGPPPRRGILRRVVSQGFPTGPGARRWSRRAFRKELASVRETADARSPHRTWGASLVAPRLLVSMAARRFGGIVNHPLCHLVCSLLLSA